MTSLFEIQTSFSSGELDPKVRGQTDLKLYNQGLRLMRNLARLSGGGVERRAGTLDLASLPGRARLIDFEFSYDQRYLAAFGNGRVDMFDLDGVLLQSITGCPWDATTMRQMSYSQNGDVMILTHNNFLRELKRVSAVVFELNTFDFLISTDGNKKFQPYYKFADDTVTMIATGATGAITLTASATTGWGGFIAAHVGERIRIYDTDVLITAITSTTIASGTVLGTLKGKLDIDAFKSTAGSAVVEVQHPLHGLTTGQVVTLAGANTLGAKDDGTLGILTADMTGAFVITVLDENRYSFISDGTAEVSEDGGGSNLSFTPINTPTRQWLEPSINSIRGYPSTGCFHDGRLWLAGTPSQPDGYWGSDALQHRRFDVGKGYDGQSVQGAAGLESLSTIRHMISNGDLQVFTPTSEGVFVTRSGEPITPTNQRIERQSSSGSGFIMPQTYDRATLFVQENGLSISEMVYSSQQGGYLSTPVSLIASHLIQSGPTDSAVTGGTSARSEQYAFFPNGDGDIAVFHSMRAENVAGWGLWSIANCKVHSVAAIGADIFICVERTGAVFRLYKFTPERLHSLDGAVEHTSATAKSDWVLDARVRSRTMSVRSERGYHGVFAIPANGVFTLNFDVTTLIVGDAYYYTLETNPPRVQLPSGARDRLIKRIVRTIIEFDETESAKVNGQPVLLKQVGIDPSVAPEPLSGSYEFRQLGFEPSPTITVTQDEPVFARILAMTLEVKV